MRKSIALLAFLTLGALSSAAFAEQVDNPVYVSWAKYKPGTTVTYKQTAEMSMMQGMKTETTITTKLVEVKPEAVTLESTTKMSIGGQEFAAPGTGTPIKQTIPAKVEKGQENIPPGVNANNAQVKDMKDGKDNVEVSGKKYDTATHEFTMIAEMPANAGGGTMNMQVKTWNTTDVPGGFVKSESNGTVGVAGTVKNSLILADYTIAK